MPYALTYEFDDLQPASTTVTMLWEKVAVPFKVEVNVNEAALASLHNQLRGRAQYEWQSWDEAAAYLLDNKLSAEEAVKDADRSIQLEERFENVMTKSRGLAELGKKDEAVAARNKALSMGNAQQIHGYGRQLQGQGKQEEAFEIFRVNIKRFPDHWVAHNEAARLACAKGDFDGAAKEMRVAVTIAPDQIKPPLEALAKRLDSKQDINK